MRAIVDPDCKECEGKGFVRCGDSNTGQNYECFRCQKATALAWLLIRIGSWTNARWDQHVRYEFGDETADRLKRDLEKARIPLKELAEQPVDK